MMGKVDILISGASGFLGTHFCEYFNQVGIKYQTISRSGADINCDLGLSIPDIKQRFDLIIHSAGRAHIRPVSDVLKSEIYTTNVLGTINFLNGIENSGFIPKYFVYISSVSVYGKISGLNIPENETLFTNDTYGESKVISENLIKNWCLENNVICTILRLPLVVGSNPPGNLGSMINAIRRGYYFNISKGAAIKSMVLASDVAKHILKVAMVGGIYNLTDGCHPSFNDLTNCIAKQLGKNFVPNMSMFLAKKLAFCGDKIGNKFPMDSEMLRKITSSLTFDDSKARKAFGWDPTPVLKGFKIK